MFKRIAPVVALSLLSGCTALKGDENHQATLDTIQAIQKSESNISNNIANLELHISNQMDYIDSLEGEIASLKSQVSELQTIVNQPPPVAKAPPKPAPPVVVKKAPARQVVLGEIEQVTIDEIKQTFDARIDTGAATSSLNAVDIEEFERNGKDWVRFHLADANGETEDTNWIEAPIVRYVRIRQSTSDATERRAVVELWVKLGTIHEKTPFTLADRSQMTHPILLGREFIRDIAVVDVSRSYIQTESK